MKLIGSNAISLGKILCILIHPDYCPTVRLARRVGVLPKADLVADALGLAQACRTGTRRARNLALIALETSAFEKPHSGRIPN